MKRVFRYLFFILLLSYMIAAYFLFGNRANHVECTGMDINILDSAEMPFVRSIEIERLIKREALNPKGKLLGSLNTEAIEAALSNNMLLKRVECYKTPSGVLRIDVTQRRPILRVFGTSGSFYVDSDGKTMPISPNFSAYLPIASGCIDRQYASKELFPFINYISEDEFWDAQIEQIVVLPNHEVELVPRVGSHIIFLGKLSQFEEKLSNLKLFYEKALPTVGWNRYERISLKYKNQVICTLKN